MRLILIFSRWWSITALIVALSLLGIAHAFQEFDNLAPCHLCLKQRDIYWIAVGVAGLSSFWALFTGAKGPPRVFSFVLFAIFLSGTVIAVYHTGAEQKWWAGPQACAARAAEVSLDDIAAMLSGLTKTQAPQCNVVAWSMFGISMAGYNAIISFVLALLSLLASMRVNWFARKSRPVHSLKPSGVDAV
jgi:disulfide bond formation protein DsbB